jgi:hypothetical protein
VIGFDRSVHGVGERVGTVAVVVAVVDNVVLLGGVVLGSMLELVSGVENVAAVLGPLVLLVEVDTDSDDKIMLVLLDRVDEHEKDI